MANMPENNLVSQRVRQFDVKHSKNHPSISDGAMVYYADGAMRDVNPLGVLMDAVEDRWEPNALERRIALYWELRLRKAEDAFHQKREDWLRFAKVNQRERYVQPPPENATKAANELRALKQEVVVLRHQLKEARKVMDDNKPEFYWERLEKSDKHSKENSQFIDAVESIQI